ncbi:MAG: hypothetical protein AAGA85_03960 [Bacteroidota bacterium]
MKASQLTTLLLILLLFAILQERALHLKDLMMASINRMDPAALGQNVSVLLASY